MAVNKKSSQLLQLVDKLIGNVLQNNLYTDLDTYLNKIKVLTGPYAVPQANVNDTRPLQFAGPAPEHPHTPKVGLNAKIDVFPPPIHDNRPDFLNRPGPLRVDGTQSESDLINQSVLPGHIPDQADFGITPDPLNFPGPNSIHPHDSLTGINPNVHVFPYRHDNRPDFLNPAIPARS